MKSGLSGDLYKIPSRIGIVGKVGPTSPFSKNPLFLETQDVPTFYRSIGKTKVLNDAFNRFVHKFYPQSILNFGRIFIKVVKCKFDIMPFIFLVNFMKNGCQLEKGI